MQARIFELTDSLQAATEALTVKDAQLSALRTEKDAALAAQASAFDREKAALQSELEALKASSVLAASMLARTGLHFMIWIGG